MFIFIDTETTGTEEKDRLCQVAYKTEDGNIVNAFFNPGMPIAIEAMAVHHITNEMVKNKPRFQESVEYQKLKELAGSEDSVFVAHNAKFDLDMLKRDNIHVKRWVCTLKLARFLDKNGVIPQYNLQFLRYYLGLKVNASAHDALGDIMVLEGVFSRIYAKIREMFGDGSIDEMIKISKNPIMISRMPFGKHKGLKFNDIPNDYLRWLAGTDLDEDMAFTVKHYL